MDIKQLIHDDDAVSPVIGVILMVAITVILAAVIASFVLGLGDSAGDAAPSVSASCDLGSSPTTMDHDGGDELDPSNIEIVGNGSVDGSASNFTAGDTIADNVDDGDQLRWDNPDGGSSSIIAEC